MTQNTVRDQNSHAVQAADNDNVVTRAQQDHSLLDWQTDNPLQEQDRMPRLRRRRKMDWDTIGIAALMASTALVAADLLIHMAG